VIKNSFLFGMVPTLQHLEGFSAEEKIKIPYFSWRDFLPLSGFPEPPTRPHEKGT